MTTLIIGMLIPLFGTMLGSAFVFLMQGEMSDKLQKSLLGFASGVMVAASVWSLLIPSMEMAQTSGPASVIPAAVGFLLGIAFLLLIDDITPHLHIGTDKPEGMRSRLSKTAMLTLAVTIHNLPEGMAVGVVFAGVGSEASTISLTGAIAVAVGIAIQNVPERSGRAPRSPGSITVSLAPHARAALYAFLRSWGHDLCSDRGTDSRSLWRQA